VWHFVPCGT